MFETKIVSSYRIAEGVSPKNAHELAASINETMNDITERGGRIVEQSIIKARARGKTSGKIDLVDNVLYVAKFDTDTGGCKYHATVVSPHLSQAQRVGIHDEKSLYEYADEVNEVYTNAANHAGRVAFYDTIMLDSSPRPSVHSLLLAEMPL